MPSIRGWADCGFLEFPGESPPDILPLTEGNAWGVTKQAYDGQTYISMVTRQSGKYESVSQELSNPLLRGKCYNLKLYLALSPVDYSKTSASSDLESFSHPVVLRIWGGREKCDKFELLGQSDPVDHYEWKEYSFDVTIPLEIHSITLEAFYKNSSVEYNGHILVDHLSPMVEIECD